MCGAFVISSVLFPSSQAAEKRKYAGMFDKLSGIGAGSRKSGGGTQEQDGDNDDEEDNDSDEYEDTYTA